MSDIDPSLPPKKARALTYSEMMNGGRAQMDERAYERELELKRRETALEKHVSYLERSFKIPE